MLDIAFLRKDLDAAVARLQTRKNPQPFLNVDVFRALEGERKTLQTRTEELQSQRNHLSKQIGIFKGKGEHAQADAAMAQVGAIKDGLEASALRLEVIQAELQTLLLAVPNLPHASVPVGADELHGTVIILQAQLHDCLQRTETPGELRIAAARNAIHAIAKNKPRRIQSRLNHAG